ncbi:helix-turn-helix transcriptional regulator, partial [Streptomyces sp. ME18-1-4]|uniref:helix-turn-helix domain-containing protein n=1 Tax=Streptomyces sp. ME18-1-4 TaxID=3028685 RepID=UPI0029A2CA9B
MSTDDGVGDVTEFAALLTELKGRTERSYGSLARRLGMNTSTLHRYCAGEAVPQDFAPVERLAEFCGATSEERLELHRRWLRAVAARQQRAARSVTAPEAPEAPEAPTLRETRGTSEALETLVSPETPGTSPEADTRPSAETEPRQSVGQQAPSRRWYRRRRVTVLVGVACAILATLGSLSALPGGHHPSASDDAGRAPGSTADPYRTASPHLSPTPTTSTT